MIRQPRKGQIALLLIMILFFVRCQAPKSGGAGSSSNASGDSGGSLGGGGSFDSADGGMGSLKESLNSIEPENAAQAEALNSAEDVAENLGNAYGGLRPGGGLGSVGAFLLAYARYRQQALETAELLRAAGLPGLAEIFEQLAGTNVVVRMRFQQQKKYAYAVSGLEQFNAETLYGYTYDGRFRVFIDKQAYSEVTQQPVGNAVALYRCRNNVNTDHYISNEETCGKCEAVNGKPGNCVKTLPGPLGYISAVPTPYTPAAARLGRFLFRDTSLHITAYLPELIERGAVPPEPWHGFTP